MKISSIKKLIVIVILLLITFMIVKSMLKFDSKGIEIGMIYDASGTSVDSGFNQDCFDGIISFAENNNKTYEGYELKNGINSTLEDKLEAVDRAVANGAEILILPGYSQEEVIKIKAPEYKNVKFVFIDGNSLGYENVTAITYREEESGFLAGYAAVYDGYTNIGGTFGGGGKNPAVNRFLYGFAQGIAKAAQEKKKKINFRYSFKYGELFAASRELQNQIFDWYDEKGVQLVFACGGEMVYSVKVAAEATKSGKIIGVDVDQSFISPRIITSAKKGLKESVVKVLTQFYQGLWDKNLAFKTQNLGVMDDATGIPYEKSKFKSYSFWLYKQNVQDIKDGFVIIKSETPEDCNNLTWLKEAFKDNKYIEFSFE